MDTIDDTTPRGSMIGLARAIDRGVCTLARHWLAYVNTFMLLYLATVVLAPLLVAAGHGGWARPIYWVNGLICHQRDDRSFHVAGEKLACCQRCAAIYSSALFLGILFIGMRHHLRPPSLRLVALFALPIFVDGMTQLIGLRESTWELRVATGFVFALGACWLIYPHLETAFTETREQIETRLSPNR